MTTTDMLKLLKEFEPLPKHIPDPTYLEICKYPQRRFEEICSRLLCFYFAPLNEHGLGDLFLSSLLDTLSPDNKLSIDHGRVKVICEENAEGKRLDILIQSDTFTIGIENKITAAIYNPLATYKNRIDVYGEKNNFKLVLSLRKITDKNELAILKNNNFARITYQELFDAIKKKIGHYLHQASQKYLTFLTDFMQTLENMDGQNILNKQLMEFFWDNYTKIEELSDLFGRHKQQVKGIQCQRIAEIKDQISEATNDQQWRAWEGWDLVYDKFNPAKPRIGIESHYHETRGNALGSFTITITAWELRDWAYYEAKLLEKFPGSLLDKSDGRPFLYSDNIDGDSEELILSKLKERYEYLNELTK